MKPNGLALALNGDMNLLINSGKNTRFLVSNQLSRLFYFLTLKNIHCKQLLLYVSISKASNRLKLYKR